MSTTSSRGPELHREALAFHIDGLIRGGDPVPTPVMSFDDAIASHSRSRADAGAEWLVADGDVMATLLAQFETVEVEVPTSQANLAS